jgi:hypothetical protein
MVPWESLSVSNSFCQRCRHAFGNFFHAFHKDQPRWISLTKPVKGYERSWINSLLGFDAETSIQFLMFTGLIKVGHSQNPTATISQSGISS